MPFEKGRLKTGGKKAGTLNRLSLLAIERLAQLNCDPLQGMARIAANRRNPVELRARMFAELAQYIHPKRRAVEWSGPGGEPIELNVNARELLLSRINSLASRVTPADGSRPPGS